MDLYPYQERVKKLVQSGKSVILQAPTGAGKTRAALAPFIEAFLDFPPEVFPRKCIYSVPMRVLANQFVTEYKGLVDAYKRKFRHSLTVGIQTGDRPDDPRVENNLVFTTIDQTLSNFLNIPYGLGKGQANLNAGAIVSSYLVFDELHLYDPDTMLPTTLEMLRMLKGITPFVAMTATFSTSMLARLADMLDAVVVPEDDLSRQDMESIGSQVGKTRRFYAVDAPLTAQAVLASEKQGQRTICICNTVRAAQGLYQEIKRSLSERGDNQTQVCLLHSRFYKDDRDQKEAWIREQFGKAQAVYDGPPLILIATQVIEVGVDATCDVMHTEIAPAASILQRAGRCARRDHETGDVFVYLPRDKEGNPNYAPYALKNKPRETARGLRLCLATWDAFNDSQFVGQPMSFGLEQALIDRVHSPIDVEILDVAAAGSGLVHQKIMETMQNQDMGAASELIREGGGRFVFVHPAPETDENLAHNPWYYDGFTFSPELLASALKDLSQAENLEDTPWLMKAARQVQTSKPGQDEEQPARSTAEYTWYSLRENKEIFGAPVLALHPSVAHYDSDLGIVIMPSDGSYELRKRSRGKKVENYSYHRETYAEHIAGLYRAYTQNLNMDVERLSLRAEMAYVILRLEKKFGLPVGAIDQMLRVVLACHDLGKLNVPWQKWAHTWQRQVGQFYPGQETLIPDDYMAAHTDYDNSPAQRAAQRKLVSRPNHAGEAAVAAMGVLEKTCSDNEALYRAGLTAIARHHTAAAENYHAYQAHPAAKKSFVEALQVAGLSPELAQDVLWQDDGGMSLARELITFQKTQEVMFYFLLARALRLADQRSQSF